MQEAAAQFWTGYLASASQSLDLVLDKTRTSATAEAPRNLVRLENLGQKWREDGLSGMTLLAAFHAYVARISSQELVTLGVQPSLLLDAAGSAAADTRAPLLPLSCPPVGPRDTLATHAAQLEGKLAQLLPHSHMPLPAICAAAGIEAASSMQHPVFQAGVVVDDGAGSAAAAASQLDLALVLVPGKAGGHAEGGCGGGVCQVALLYNSGLYTEESAAMTARHFEVFVNEVTKRDGSSPQPLLAAALMDERERELVLRGFNQTGQPYDDATYVHAQFALRARETPDAPCVVYEDHVFSYAEIDAASNRVAHYLACQAGVAPGDMVAVLVLRSPVMIAALMGVLKAGAGYLPLDHHHPEGRIEFMLEDAAVKAVIVQPDLLHKLPSAASLAQQGIHTLQVHPEVPFATTSSRSTSSSTAAGFAPVQSAQLAASALGAAAEESPTWEQGQLGGPDTCCYIIYTSGSTGKPKGVVVQHKGLTAYVAWFRSHFGITSRDVFIQKTPTNFDASIDELWTSLTAGATLVVAPPEAHRDVFSVMQLITRHSVTTASAVPSQLQMLAREILALHSPEQVAAGTAPCASLKQVLSGGEALTTTMARDISSALPRCNLWNTCGPTETTVGITAWLYEAPNAAAAAAPAAATIPIGRGISNSRLYVLDAGLSPVPVGVPGELYISGVQVAQGYLNRPELNDKTFVPNPFCEGPGSHTSVMYRAGDLVRWLPGQHACLEFLGRVDHQVKLRGFRIELQEIEAALGALPGVVQVATALAKNPATNQDQLVAWVTPEGLDPQALVQQLQGALPEYMIPTVVVCMPALPLLPSEKVNRKALPAPDFVRHAVKAPAKAAAAAAAAKQQKQQQAKGGAAASAASSTSSSSSSSRSTSHDSSSSISISSAASSGCSSPTAAGPVVDPLVTYVGEVWAEVLGLDPASLDPTSDFMALGGSSLLAGRMNSKLRAGLTAPSLSGMLIYQHTSLAAFCQGVAKAGPVLPPGYAASLAPTASLAKASISSSSGSDSEISNSSCCALSHTSEGSGGREPALLQRFIAEAWGEVLGLDPASLDPTSDFFSDCGGSSLLSGRMNSKLRVGLSLPSLSGMLIYQHTSLGAFTEAVAKAGAVLPGADVSLARQASVASSSSAGSFRIGVASASLAGGRTGSGGTMSTSFSSAATTSTGTSGSSKAPAPGQNNSFATRAGVLTAEAAARAAVDGFAQQQGGASAAYAAAAGSWVVPPHLALPVEFATKAAYAAANAAFQTVLSSLGYAMDDDGLPLGGAADGAKKAGSGAAASVGSVFSKHFRLGAGAAGGATVAAMDVAMRQHGLPSSLPASSLHMGKDVDMGKVLDGGQEQQVRPSVALCTLLQVLLVSVISGVAYAINVLPTLGWMWLLAFWGWRAIGLLPLLNLVGLIGGVAWTVAGKWAFIGRYKEGQHPIWGWQYVRHWAANQFVVGARNSYVSQLKRTTLINWFYRALGMRVGDNVRIDTDDFLGFDLIELQDGAVLDTFSGVTSITFEAGRPSSRFPTGTMTLKRASVGAGAVVGAHAMVVCADVPPGGVVQPCTASNNPPAAWSGSRWPQTGPQAVTAAKTQDKPLGVLSGLLALVIADEVLALLSYPVIMGFMLLWAWLSGYSLQQVPLAAGDSLQCLVNMPWAPISAAAAVKCNTLMMAAIKTMLLYPTVVLLVSQLAMLLIIPVKWILVGKAKPSPEGLTLTPTAKPWGQAFRSHLMQLLLDHPGLKLVLYSWTGTCWFNAWLRGMGAKVGRQAWIGEGLQLHEHDLVEIGDCVSVCSSVSMMPSTVMGSAKITIHGGADVTNQTCLYPGVTVRPGAVLGVFTYAEAGRTFQRDSIVQGPMVLMPGRPEPEEGGPPVGPDPAAARAVSAWHYFKFNAFYTLIMLVLLPLTVQLSTLPFYIASTVLVFKTGLFWAALLVPVSWMINVAMETLWMMLVKMAMLRRCTGDNPFYQYTHTAWMITGILYYFHQLALMKTLSGSQLAVWYYRAMGSKIGKGVLLNSLSSNEPDCLTIGDGVVIDDLSFVMCHSVENRCVKFHDVIIGDRVTIGCGSAVMPGCIIHDDATVGDVSIVMKAETIPAGAVWRGVPAVPVQEQA